MTSALSWRATAMQESSAPQEHLQDGCNSGTARGLDMGGGEAPGAVGSGGAHYEKLVCVG